MPDKCSNAAIYVLLGISTILLAGLGLLAYKTFSEKPTYKQATAESLQEKFVKKLDKRYDLSPADITVFDIDDDGIIENEEVANILEVDVKDYRFFHIETLKPNWYKITGIRNNGTTEGFYFHTDICRNKPNYKIQQK